MEIGIAVYAGIEFKTLVELYKKYGIKRTFIGSETDDFDERMDLLNKYGIVCETLHAPYSSGNIGCNINEMWKEGEMGEVMLSRLTDAVDKCHKYNIPVVITHVSSGRPMPEISHVGLDRYDRLMEYAKEKNVIIAYENLRFRENLDFLMGRHPDAGFCWDNGHEYCSTPGENYISYFGQRLAALHIHDNSCEYDADDHVLPFDGNIDMSRIAQSLASSGYEGTLMLEIAKNVKMGGKEIYAGLTDEEYIERAVSSAKKLADMVEDIRNKK